MCAGLNVITLIIRKKETKIMIVRVFKVQVHSSLRDEFEHDFNTLSKKMMMSASGCIRQSVLKPTKWAPDEYAMISEWETESDLELFVGQNWYESVIPTEMERYAISHSVSHYTSWD